MEAVRQFISNIFTYFFYPIIVIGVFLTIIITVIVIIAKGKETQKVVRRLTGALLPLAILVFLVIGEKGGQNIIEQIVTSTTPVLAFIIGGVVGLLLMELGKILLKTDSEIGPASYAFFLSLIAMFILYSFILNLLSNLHGPLLGLIMSGGLDVIFRGLPEFDK